MKKRNILITICILCIPILTQAQEQQAFSSASNSVTIEGNTYHYTIGEMTLVSTEKNHELIVTQGFLQPVEKQIPSAIAPLNTTNLIHVYPNPTSDILQIDLKESNDNYNYLLLDVTGKAILKGSNENKNNFTISVKPLASGTYYLYLSKQQNSANHAVNADVQNFTYKIQKTN